MEYLAITLLGPTNPSLINNLGKLANHCKCNIVESRISSLGNEFVAHVLLGGTWNAVAKFEASISTFENKNDVRCLTRRTHLREANPDKLPYTAYIIAPDAPGIVYKLTQYFDEQNIPIHDMSVHSYKAPFTESIMLSITMSFTISTKKMVADFREGFMVFCDEHNYDAVMEPQKP